MLETIYFTTEKERWDKAEEFLKLGYRQVPLEASPAPGEFQLTSFSGDAQHFGERCKPTIIVNHP